MYSMVLRSLCVRSRGDLEGSTRCGKMPVVQDAAHSPTGAASARPAESPAIAGPPTPANDEPAARAMPPAPAIGKSNPCGSTRVRFI
jgi:hypothetical protein